MRRGTILRESRLMHAAVGATILAAPASAALADPLHSVTAQSATSAGDSVQARVRSRKLRYGQAAVVTGHAPSSDDGQAIFLQFEPAGSTSWRTLTSGRIAADGSFRLRAPLRNSGRLKVSVAGQASPASVVLSGSASSDSSSTPQRVAVSAALRTRPRTRDVLGARTVAVRGQLLPRQARRRVVLQGRQGRRWITLASAHTGDRGRFTIRYRARLTGKVPLRLRFAGDRSNTAVTASAGRLLVFHQSLASWYEDGGTTGCGFHAHYGVANKSLPCGTRVAFSHAGRTVIATVDDRGPYVGGREWDLNQNTAAALGFGGVGIVWSSS
jgi:rare lipoprotein A